MKIFVITGSVTYAMKAVDILRTKHYPATVKRIEENRNRIGCGYGVITEKSALPLLKKSGIKILKVEETENQNNDIFR